MAEKVISVSDSITVGELAQSLNIPVITLIGELFKNGIVATINQRIDFETATIIVQELKLDVELEKKTASKNSERQVYVLSENAVSRPPIVAVMGHVDHGKTSLLDSILHQKIVDDEAGGITQHISAYQTIHNDRSITFLDTPGHEAFAALRQHGAALTDVVIIVVAADDGVKPQTIEAIRFAKTANAKIVVAINKIDKEAANPQLVKTQLATEHNLNPEEWGGDTVMVELSAKTGKNIDKLLDMVLLVADLEELKADIDVPSQGLVIESHMETGKGSVVGLLIEQGLLKTGQFLIAGTTYGKVRTLLDFNGKAIKSAGPATPVTVTGFKDLPQFGNVFSVVANEKIARSKTALAKIEHDKNAASSNVTGADLLKMMTQEHETQNFNVIVKADVQGSLTSVMDSLRLGDSEGEITMRIIGSGVGNISENDIRLATNDNTIIYGFNVELPTAIKQLAMRDNVQVRNFNVIYELLDDARNSMNDMLAPDIVETEIGKMIIKSEIKKKKDEVIAGGEVLSGKIIANTLVRIIRGKEKIAEAEITKVQRQQQEAKEVFAGEMCGISIKLTSKIVIEEGDILELFSRELVKRKLH